MPAPDLTVAIRKLEAARRHEASSASPETWICDLVSRAIQDLETAQSILDELDGREAKTAEDLDTIARRVADLY